MYYSHANLDLNFVCLATESVIKSTMVPNLYRLQEFAAFVGVYEGMHVAYVTLTHRLRRARTTHTGVCHERQRGRTPEGSSNGRTGGGGRLQATMSRGWIPTPTTTYAQGNQMSCVNKQSNNFFYALCDCNLQATVHLD